MNNWLLLVYLLLSLVILTGCEKEPPENDPIPVIPESSSIVNQLDNSAGLAGATYSAAPIIGSGEMPETPPTAESSGIMDQLDDSGGLPGATFSDKKESVTEQIEPTPLRIEENIFRPSVISADAEVSSLTHYSKLRLTPFVFPYVDEQFYRHGRHDFADGSVGYCANEHYHAKKGKALDVYDLQWVDESDPARGCGYSGQVSNYSFPGVQIEGWLSEYNR